MSTDQMDPLARLHAVTSGIATRPVEPPPARPMGPPPWRPVGPPPGRDGVPTEPQLAWDHQLAQLSPARSTQPQPPPVRIRKATVAAPSPTPVHEPAQPAIPMRRDSVSPPSKTESPPRGDSAASRAAATYSTAYGHPTSHTGFAGFDDGKHRRWSLMPRTAMVVVVALLVVAAVASVMVLRSRGGDVVYLTDKPGSTAGSGTAATDNQNENTGAQPGVGNVDTTAADTTGATATGVTANGPATTVVVHVVGQVNRPGLVTLGMGARVSEAVDAAGGAAPDADLAAVNLARLVVDGEQIVIPRPGEVITPAPGATGTGSQAGAGSATGDVLVDLNTADAAALDALPGIGPVLAQRIVEWRTENGRFTSVDELGEVSGIGPAVLAKLRDRVRV